MVQREQRACVKRSPTSLQAVKYLVVGGCWASDIKSLRLEKAAGKHASATDIQAVWGIFLRRAHLEAHTSATATPQRRNTLHSPSTSLTVVQSQRHHQAKWMSLPPVGSQEAQFCVHSWFNHSEFPWIPYLVWPIHFAFLLRLARSLKLASCFDGFPCCHRCHRPPKQQSSPDEGSNASGGNLRAAHIKVMQISCTVFYPKILSMVAKSCSILHGWNPTNNGIFPICQLVQDLATMHSR